MATYLTPGVYVEENLTPGNQGQGSAALAVGAFVGLAGKGPTLPTKVRTWAQFVNLFGDFKDSSGSYLPHAVYQFFLQGGAQCYIVRTVRADATSATATLMDSADGEAGPQAAFTITALAEGAWGNTTSVQIVPTGAPGGRFELRVLDNGVVKERFGDLSSNPDDPRYALSIVNSPYAGSLLVKIANVKTTNPDYVYDPVVDIIPQQSVTLTGGDDGSQPYDYVEAVKKLEEIDSTNFDLNLPGVSDPNILNAVIQWCEEKKNAFLVIDGPRGAEGATAEQIMQGYTSLVEGPTALTASSYAAVYGPWVMCQDPSSSMFGAARLLPPGGLVLGQMGRNDIVRHPAKAPAGTETRLERVLYAEARFSEEQLDELALAHVNVIRNVPGFGHCIMGARTLKRTLPDLYVPVRRMLIFLRKAMKDQLQWAVMEPNGPDLWDKIRLVLTHYLSMVRKAGMLEGLSDAEAFFVRCDGDNNPRSEINAGRLHVDVGVALRYPAEFIIIHLGNTENGPLTADELLF